MMVNMDGTDMFMAVNMQQTIITQATAIADSKEGVLYSVSQMTM